MTPTSWLRRQSTYTGFGKMNGPVRNLCQIATRGAIQVMFAPEDARRFPILGNMSAIVERKMDAVSDENHDFQRSAMGILADAMPIKTESCRAEVVGFRAHKEQTKLHQVETNSATARPRNVNN